MIRFKTKWFIVRDPLPTDIDEWHRLLSDSKTMYYLPDIMTHSPLSRGFRVSKQGR